MAGSGLESELRSSATLKARPWNESLERGKVSLPDVEIIRRYAFDDVERFVRRCFAVTGPKPHGPR